jgi:prolyl-tRNA synthetase
LIIPPKIAPTHVVIVPIVKDEDRGVVVEKAMGLAEVVSGCSYNGKPVSVHVDDRQGFRPGYKFAHWELRGIPLRIEVGPRDIAEGSAVLANRLTGDKRKLSVDWETYSLDLESVSSSLEEIQAGLYTRSRKEIEGRIYEVGSYGEFKEVIAEGRGFVLAPWDGSAETEARVKEETSATTRVLATQMPGNHVKCLFSEGEAKCLAYFAASY